MSDHHEGGSSFWTEAAVWVAVLALMALWVLAILKWGVLGLYLPAVISVPIIMVVMVWLSRG